MFKISLYLIISVYGVWSQATDYTQHYSPELLHLINDPNIAIDGLDLIRVRGFPQIEQEGISRALQKPLTRGMSDEIYYLYVIVEERGPDLPSPRNFQEFVKQIIYIGKGVGGRVAQHVVNAYVYLRDQKNANDVLAKRMWDRWMGGAKFHLILTYLQEDERVIFAREAAALSVFGDGNICPRGGHKKHSQARIDECQLANKAMERNHRVMFTTSTTGSAESKHAKFGVHILMEAYRRFQQANKLEVIIYD